MRLPLVRIGNSLCLRLPRKVLASLGLREGSGLFLRVEGDRLVLSRAPEHPKVQAFMEAIRPMLGKGVVLAYVFGSFTTPKFREGRSDIDLYVVVRDDETLFRVLRASSRVDMRVNGPPLGPVCIRLESVKWIWFEDEVAGGVPLYVDPKTFPHGVPPPDYLRRMESGAAEAAT